MSFLDYKLQDGTTINTAENVDVVKYVRERRNELLIACDWTQGADSPLSTAKKEEWAIYRQALRDMPVNYNSSSTLDDITFPTPPD